MKAVKYYFPVMLFITLFEVFVTFESMDKILIFIQMKTIEQNYRVLSHGAVIVFANCSKTKILLFQIQTLPHLTVKVSPYLGCSSKPSCLSPTAHALVPVPSFPAQHWRVLAVSSPVDLAVHAFLLVIFQFSRTSSSSASFCCCSICCSWRICPSSSIRRTYRPKKKKKSLTDFLYFVKESNPDRRNADPWKKHKPWTMRPNGILGRQHGKPSNISW